VIKTVNEKNYICKVKADYDFIAGLELFAYKPKNKLAYDKTHVPEFLSIFQSSYIPGTINEGTTFSEENCYQIYSTDLLKHLEYEVFKFADTCASYLLYKGEIYELGTWFGGYGVTDVAIDDLNEDGLDEIYFTYSWGSGTHWSVLEYFDTKDNTFHDLFATNRHFLEFMLIRTDLGLVVAEAYYTSAANNPLYFVDITLTYKSSLGEISYDDHIHLDHYQLDN
jgi:hypothetical protein